MSAKFKLIVGFVLLEIIDIFPFPTTTLVALYIVMKKPLWFKHLVMELYQLDKDTKMK
ncbi:hypothetical protein GO003_025480 [Methylicorpusculum oleiharenae]|uniref:hypothetical protein n=1 Tax=Methylicorpusculum oleiharenae TaxID=1338687 RepID=UPI0013DDF377|nr:hypothetical protein [Methylicorpusculum oleiharenae]MCD2453732.1 hypothetical protein [Methylicorpusculum oleiharenae]